MAGGGHKSNRDERDDDNIDLFIKVAFVFRILVTHKLTITFMCMYMHTFPVDYEPVIMSNLVVLSDVPWNMASKCGCSRGGWGVAVPLSKVFRPDSPSAHAPTIFPCELLLWHVLAAFRSAASSASAYLPLVGPSSSLGESVATSPTAVARRAKSLGRITITMWYCTFRGHGYRLSPPGTNWEERHQCGGW